MPEPALDSSLPKPSAARQRPVHRWGSPGVSMKWYPISCLRPSKSSSSDFSPSAPVKV
ncbi:hypothetical protein [Amycolatopsis mediterranei]|uniref:hypothetical protein n=1 Tax=Amycolatopsis mediterranei TaxID=33910 RepID=UPI003316BDB5